MPEITFNISIQDIAGMINNMSSQELETLYMFMTDQGSDLLERNKDLKLKKLNYMTEDEIFHIGDC